VPGIPLLCRNFRVVAVLQRVPTFNLHGFEHLGIRAEHNRVLLYNGRRLIDRIDRDVTMNCCGILLPGTFIANFSRDRRIVAGFQRVAILDGHGLDDRIVGLEGNGILRHDGRILRLHRDIAVHGSGVLHPLAGIAGFGGDGGVVAVLENVAILDGHGLDGRSVGRKGHGIVRKLRERLDGVGLTRSDAVGVVGIL